MQPQLRENPFFAQWEKGAIPFHDIKMEHYMPAYQAGIDIQNEMIDQIKAEENPDFENTIVALDNSGALMSKVMRVCSGLHGSIKTDALQKEYDKLREASVRQSLKVNFDEALFAKVEYVYKHQEECRFNDLQEDQRILLKDTYERFVDNGVALKDPATKKRLEAINLRLSELSNQYGAALVASSINGALVLSAQEMDACGLAKMKTQERETLAKDKFNKLNAYAIALDMNNAREFLANCTDRTLRKQMFEAYNGRCMGPVEVKKGEMLDVPERIKEVITLRAEKAVILSGNPAITHADWVLKDRMGYQNKEALGVFLTDFMQKAVESGKVTTAELQALMAKDVKDAKAVLEPWDWYYYERLNLEKKAVEQKADELKDLKNYFELEKVRDGAFAVANRLYGISFVRNTTYQVFHPDVQAFDVEDEDGEHLGILYTDFYGRVGQKRGGAWCGAFQSQSLDEEGERVAPVVYLCCNFTKPDAGQPCLLEMNNVTTLFHEFGHALHNLFSNVRYAGQAGTSVARDFVEMPSQVMEHWATHEEVVNDLDSPYATHYQTGKKLPIELLRKYKKAAGGPHFNTIEYTAASILDIRWHSMTWDQLKGQNKSGLEMIKEIESEVKKTTKLDQIPITFRYPTTTFNHIFNSGYDVGYYVYLAAELYECDAFAAFTESGDVFNQDLAQSLREKVLSKGNSVDLKESYKAFRGADPNPKYMYEKRELKYDGK